MSEEGVSEKHAQLQDTNIKINSHNLRQVNGEHAGGQVPSGQLTHRQLPNDQLTNGH